VQGRSLNCALCGLSWFIPLPTLASTSVSRECIRKSANAFLVSAFTPQARRSYGGLLWINISKLERGRADPNEQGTCGCVVPRLKCRQLIEHCKQSILQTIQSSSILHFSRDIRMHSLGILLRELGYLPLRWVLKKFSGFPASN
jgi:hypothetical protein